MSNAEIQRTQMLMYKTPLWLFLMRSLSSPRIQFEISTLCTHLIVWLFCRHFNGDHRWFLVLFFCPCVCRFRNLPKCFPIKGCIRFTLLLFSVWITLCAFTLSILSMGLEKMNSIIWFGDGFLFFQTIIFLFRAEKEIFPFKTNDPHESRAFFFIKLVFIFFILIDKFSTCVGVFFCFCFF